MATSCASPARSATTCRRPWHCCARASSTFRCSSTTSVTDVVPERDPIEDTRRWLERAVIGLNLCPFAKAVYVKDQVRFVLSDATTESALLAQLGEELALLRDTDAAEIDTTLIVHPDVLRDFLDYNDFLE